MSKKFRSDVAVAICAPPTVMTILSLVIHGGIHVPAIYMVLLGSLFAELLFLREGLRVSVSDNGVLSGFSASLVAFTFWIMASSDHVGVFASCALILCGSLLRLVAKLTLSSAFSHSIGISSNHRLITGGIYGVIRHPAYLGTIFICAGTAAAVSIPSAILVAAITAFFATVRVRKEEQMLGERFGSEFVRYCNETGRFFPRILT